MASSAARTSYPGRSSARGTRRVGRLVAAAATLALVATWAGGASAQPTAADRETARSLMQEARDLRDKGHIQDALKRFKAADDIMHVPTTGYEVAKTQAAMGMLVEARDTIANIRKLPSSPSDPAPFNEARAKADELDSTLETRIPALNITVTGAADGETPSLVIDGISVPAAAIGLPRRVNPGKHMVVAKSAHGRGEQTVDVKEGEQKDVQITISRGSGSDSMPSVDGSEAQPAAHSETPSEPEGPKSHSPTVLTWIGAGVGGAGVLAGTITGMMSISTVSKIKSNKECPNSTCAAGTVGGNDYSSASSLATVSDVGFVVAGIGAAVAVASLIIGHPEIEAASKPPENAAPPAEGDAPAEGDPAAPAPQSRVRVLPWVGLGSAGVVGVF